MALKYLMTRDACGSASMSGYGVVRTFTGIMRMRGQTKNSEVDFGSLGHVQTGP